VLQGRLLPLPFEALADDRQAFHLLVGCSVCWDSEVPEALASRHAQTIRDGSACCSFGHNVAVAWCIGQAVLRSKSMCKYWFKRRGVPPVRRRASARKDATARRAWWTTASESAAMASAWCSKEWLGHRPDSYGSNQTRPKMLAQLPAVRCHKRKPAWRRKAKQSEASLPLRSRPASATSATASMVSVHRLANSLDLRRPQTCSIGLRSGA
jgi:hypothetical protein